MRERFVEKKAIEFAMAHGWLVRKFISTRRGVSDRVFIRGGRHVWAEFKKPGEEATSQQEAEHERMRAHGAEVIVIDSIEQARELFK